MDHTKDCFVIMPFSKTKGNRDKAYWDTFYDKLERALLQHQYRATKSQATQENIVARIMEDLAWSELVVAVLTDFNPNVWYELGVRHSLQRGKTLMLCDRRQIKSLPFDLKQHGVVSYDEEDDEVVLKHKMALQLSKVHDETIDSPVSHFLKTGLYFGVTRAGAALRSAMKALTAPKGEISDPHLFAVVKALNDEWCGRGVQLTLANKDTILCHKSNEMQGRSAHLCWKDISNDGSSLHSHMLVTGKGIRLAVIESYRGRLTAIAFDTLRCRDWLVVVEAHVRQGEL